MNNRTVHWLGIYLKPPAPDIIGRVTITLFNRLILGALERENLLVSLDSLPEKITNTSSLYEMLATTVVSDLPRSFRAISAELAAASLLECSQLAWHDFDEQVWRDAANSAVPFQHRFVESRTWGAQILRLLNTTKSVLAQIKSLTPQQNP